ncbi:TPM domain-containing protein [Glaciimonas soli]|uniref:TPM domain-containing protein n=1 Tax=Glaciimonas soli TaxID=2590999 RepID=A0A843YSD9_9BURK|nr:TPM domain-containing protein [Glaciimonas soli]MQR02485.1 TPM domain-containing protein [Glaciimonas soli]
MQKTIQRLWRHLTTTRRDSRRLFPAATLQAIQAKIAEGEVTHRAEVRVIIESSMDTQAILNNMTSRHRANELFSRYRVWDTEENIGVLVYVNLADHKVEIVADRAVGRAIHKKEWQAICHTMTKEFINGSYRDSTLLALEQLNGLLTQHFPDQEGKYNEISDKPIML